TRPDRSDDEDRRVYGPRFLALASVPRLRSKASSLSSAAPLRRVRNAIWGGVFKSRSKAHRGAGRHRFPDRSCREANASMDFVELVLTTVFHISTLDALALTLAVHTNGKGIAGTYTFEVAEQKQCEVLLMVKIEDHPLRVEVERV